MIPDKGPMEGIILMGIAEAVSAGSMVLAAIAALDLVNACPAVARCTDFGVSLLHVDLEVLEID